MKVQSNGVCFRVIVADLLRSVQGLFPSPSLGVCVRSDVVGRYVFTHSMLMELDILFPLWTILIVLCYSVYTRFLGPLDACFKDDTFFNG
jgi:hypothetical protein